MRYYLFVGMESHQVSEKFAMFMASLGSVVIDSNAHHVIVEEEMNVTYDPISAMKNAIQRHLKAKKG